MGLLGSLTRSIHPGAGYVYRVGKLSYKVSVASTWLGKLETLASYLLGLVSTKAAWVWLGIKWLWSGRTKKKWSQLTEDYLKTLVPENVPISVDVVHRVACFDGDAQPTDDYWYRKAALVYLAECYKRHTAQNSTTYVSSQLLSDPDHFPIRTCLQGFFSTSSMQRLVKLARSQPGQLQSKQFWDNDVPQITTSILKEVDQKLVKDAVDLLVL